MKRIIIAVCLLFCVTNIMANTKLTQNDKERFIQCVRQYCELLKDFSGNIDNVTLVDSILAKCENDKVQTFDDISLKHSTTDVEYNSVPMFQYLQNITTKYDNELDVSFSDFQCEKTVSESSAMPGIQVSTSYALVYVVKRIKGKGIDVKVPLKISINTSSLKIGGTVSEEYEDPHSIYLNSLDLIAEGKESKARELLLKCTAYRTYAGRYRAMTELGLSYFREKRLKDAIDMLSKASEQDPVGGIFLATILCQPETPLELKNVNKALSLLEKYANNQDKDYPLAKPIANYFLACLYLQGQVMPADKKKASEYLDVARNSALEANQYDFLIAFDLFKISLIVDEDPNTALSLLDGIEPSLTYCLNYDVRIRLSMEVYNIKCLLHRHFKQFDKAIEAAEKLKEYDAAKAYYLMAEIYRDINNYPDALKNYQIAADMGEPESCLIMFSYYFPFPSINEELSGINEVIVPMHANKNKEKGIYYLKMAAEKGNLKAMENLAITYLNAGYGMQNYAEGVKWALLRVDNGSYNYQLLADVIFSTIVYEKHYELVDLIDSYSANSASANRILYCVYDSEDYQNADSLKAFHYLNKGVELGDPLCMLQMVYIYKEKNDIVRAEQICLKMIEKNYPEAFSIMGDIEKDRKNYAKAVDYFRQGYAMNQPYGAIGLGEMYLEGLGVPQSIDKAMELANKGIELAKIEGRDDLIKDAEDLLDKCKLALANGGVVPDESSASVSVADMLNHIVDNRSPVDNRISLSEKALNELFASPKAVVKTVGSNGKTVVATETAEDFLLRLSTAANINKITVVKHSDDDQGRIKELIIKEN